jgi:hypothetical protein
MSLLYQNPNLPKLNNDLIQCQDNDYMIAQKVM